MDINEASRLPLKTKTGILMKILEKSLGNTKPPVSLQGVKKYEIIKVKIDGKIMNKRMTDRGLGLNRKNQQ